MAKVYCKYCGTPFNDIRTLTFSTCPRHPDGAYKGKHALYEGSEKSEYFCKFCGNKFRDLRTLTFSTCPRHPSGPYKGKHEPAL